MITQYPIVDAKLFHYNKELNSFTAKYRSLKSDLLLYKEFIMRNFKTGNEVTFIMINNIYDLDERACGLRFVPSYEDEEHFSGLQNCFVDVLFD